MEATMSWKDVLNGHGDVEEFSKLDSTYKVYVGDTKVVVEVWEHQNGRFSGHSDHGSISSKRLPPPYRDTAEYDTVEEALDHAVSGLTSWPDSQLVPVADWR
jgi:hypothetical protein